MNSINDSKSFIENAEEEPVLNEEIQEASYISVEEGLEKTLNAVKKILRQKWMYMIIKCQT